MKLEMNIEIWGIDRLKPYWRNPRVASEDAIDRVAMSLLEFGWQQPIVVDTEGTIVAGHKRLIAAQRLGMEEVPVQIAVHLSPAQCKAYRIMDNKATEDTTWEREMLQAEFEDLREAEFDLGLTGFTQDEIDHGREGRTGQTDPDAVGDLPDEPVARVGDLWLLGWHRLRCGDCTDEAVASDALDGDAARLLLSDPPYGVDYGDLTASRENQKKGGWRKIAGDNLDDEAFLVLLTAAFAPAKAQIAFIWHAALRSGISRTALEAAGLVISQQIIWVKNALIFGRADYQWRHEPCWYARVAGAGRQRDRKATTVWEVDKIQGAQHPTQKPVELFLIPMRNHSERGEVVYDPFCGSGSVLIAAEKMELRARAVELEPAYIDVSIHRWQDFTGQQATLADGGGTFQEIEAERSTGKPPKSRPGK